MANTALPFDLAAAMAHLSATDPCLAKLIAELLPFEPEIDHDQSPYEALMEAIVYQSISGKAAATILERVKALGGAHRVKALGGAHRANAPGGANCADSGSDSRTAALTSVSSEEISDDVKSVRTLAGTKLNRPSAVNGRVPTPEEVLKLPKRQLRKAGLSGAKILSMKDLAQKTIDGVVPTHDEALKLSDEELVERLDSVRGIGRWTVEMFLIFRLGRPDVLPIHDLGVQKGWSVAYGKKHKPRPKELEKFGERWRPYRTVASWYMWRAFERAGYAATNKIKKPRVKRKVRIKVKRVKVMVKKRALPMLRKRKRDSSLRSE
jgi:3-methyladenine DNA glycosylase/8-oxoguanine DNA glycosylase